MSLFEHREPDLTQFVITVERGENSSTFVFDGDKSLKEVFSTIKNRMIIHTPSSFTVHLDQARQPDPFADTNSSDKI